MNKESQELLIHAARWLIHAAEGTAPPTLAACMASRLTIVALTRESPDGWDLDLQAAA